MKLNFGKCINLTMNRKISTVKFRDGTKVPRLNKAIYLGSLLTDTANNTAELANRIAMTNKTAHQLKIFWNKAKTDIKWKATVYNAVIRSKLLYGLEGVQLTQSERNKLDAFQIKGLRRILQVPPTFIDRSWTNHRVIDTLRQQHNIKVHRFSDMWKAQKLSLLGHVLRASQHDPMRQVIFEGPTKIPRICHCKRVGKPRADWLIETMKDALHALGTGEVPEKLSNEHFEHVSDKAALREGPFATKSKKPALNPFTFP